VTSYLSIYDLEKGRIIPVLQTETLIEAPNWTPDGKTLIVNGQGMLFRVSLDDPGLERIDTGPADSLNNDHGVSPDGQTLVISDASAHGDSCIYTLPIGGGDPQQITKNVPSWWHGWSPDGKTLAYAARRESVMGIYTIAVSGGTETCLNQDLEHCDGPDYTPDGAWIWFNGARAGAMDLWRMRPDGNELQRMTDEPTQNWFPHPSPDGRQVLYLAYESGVFGHPRNHSVKLRLMPSGGGPSRPICELYGGQGSLNVPCWHPDGSLFAFVAYREPGL